MPRDDENDARLKREREAAEAAEVAEAKRQLELDMEDEDRSGGE